MMENKVLALFDFDGTISKKDSFFDFLYYYSGKRAFFKNAIRLLPVAFAYQLRLLSKHDAKERVFGRFLKGVKEHDLEEKAHIYTITRLRKIIKDSALERIKWHKSQNHDIVIVSGSAEVWLQKWCQNEGVDLIATGLEVVEGVMTGKLSTKNCYGEEKVTRIKERYDLEKYDYIYAYGNSKGDKQMLKLAHENYYKNFN